MPRAKLNWSRVLGWLVATTTILGLGVLTTQVWSVSRIECYQADQACNDAVMSSLSPLLETSLFWHDHQASAAALLIHEGYQLQRLGRRLPSTLILEVTAQPALLQVKLDETHWAVVNQDLHYIFSDHPLELPTVELSPEQLGDRQVVEKLAELITALQHFEIHPKFVRLTATAVVLEFSDSKRALLPLESPAARVPELKLLLDSNLDETHQLSLFDLRFALPVLRPDVDY